MTKPEARWLALLALLFGPPEETAASCRCGGSCTCHYAAQFGGKPCPPSCKNFGNHFDGCHACDPQCAPKPRRPSTKRTTSSGPREPSNPTYNHPNKKEEKL